jgi:hypothetical protein
MIKPIARVLVMGAGGTAGMNFIRCLRVGLGYFLIGCDINQYHLKLCEGLKVRTYQSPLCSDPGYIDFINDLIVREDIDFVHAQPDVEVEALSINRDHINARTFLPSHGTILKCRDKFETSRILDQLAPVSMLVDDNRLDRQVQELQDVSKNKKLWLRAIKGAGSRASLPITSAKQACNWINYWREEKELESRDFMLSEFLPGREFAFQSVWNNGEIVCSMARERLEYLMGNLFPSGQSSSPSVAKTVHDGGVNGMATKAILKIDPKATGVFCVDMKEDSFGWPRITEINAGRFFTTSNFFANCGANMPDIYVRLGMGLTCSPLKDITPSPRTYFG